MRWLFVLPFIALIIWYALKGRAWLKTTARGARFLAWIEPYEIVLFKKSETILWARIKVLAGLTLMVLAQLGTIDLSPLIPFVPDQYEGLIKFAFNLLPLIVALDGSIGEKLRNGTTKPIELIAAPTTPKTIAAEEKVDAANAVAVAVAEKETAKAA
jgi:hypothetical protein